VPVTRLFSIGLAAWAVTLVTVLALRASFSTAMISGPETAGWLFLAGVPPIVILMVFRRTPPTVGQVLYDAENPRASSTPKRDPGVGR
jgi:hypothetical protein